MARRIGFGCLVFLVTWAVVLFILSQERHSYSLYESPSLHQRLHDQIQPKTGEGGDLWTIKSDEQKSETVDFQIPRNQNNPLKEPEQQTPDEVGSRPPTRFRDRFHKMYSWHLDIGSDNVTDPTKYLIYRCDTMSRCGGWTDRFRGVMAGYIIANLTGRVFKSEILLPSCDIKNYIVPNLVNWSLPISFHKRVTVGKEVRKMEFTGGRKFWQKVKNTDFTSLPAMKAKYIYYKSNLDYMDGFKNSIHFQRQVSWMKNLTRDQINALIFKRLFKLPPNMENKLDAFLAKNLDPRNRLVCIHVRMGRNPTIPEDTADRVREGDLPRIWSFLSGIAGGKDDKIFIMSDSENVIHDAQKQSFHDKLFFTPGKVVHVENSKNVPFSERCAGLEKVLLEQFILMHCDSLVISKSGLSRMAAYVRGSDQDLYCLLDKGLIVPCKNKDVQQVFGIMG